MLPESAQMYVLLAFSVIFHLPTYVVLALSAKPLLSKEACDSLGVCSAPMGGTTSTSSLSTNLPSTPEQKEEGGKNLTKSIISYQEDLHWGTGKGWTKKNFFLGHSRITLRPTMCPTMCVCERIFPLRYFKIKSEIELLFSGGSLDQRKEE